MSRLIIIRGNSGSGKSTIAKRLQHEMGYGEMLQELADLFERTHVYYFDISLEETLRRHQTKPNSHEFGEEQMREWYVKKDSLEMPGEKIFTDNKSEDEVFRSILEDLQ